MGDVSRAIQHYIYDHIRLSQKDISKSIRTRDWLVSRIISKIEEKTNEPVLYTPKRFLNFGSYFKGTKVKVVDEFDILIIVDTNTGQYLTKGIKVGDGLGSSSPNNLFDAKYMKSDGSGVSPTKLLNWLKGIVKEILQPQGADLPVRNEQAVVAYLSGSNTTIDLVPAAIMKRTSDDKVFYAIPKGGSSNSWLSTSPEDDMKAVEDAANNRDNFKNVIRICKRIKDTYKFTQLTSFAVETIVVSYIWHNDWYQNLYVDCRGALNYLASILKSGLISDPFSGDNLLEGATSLDIYAGRIGTIVATLDRCVKIDDQAKIDELVTNAFENN